MSTASDNDTLKRLEVFSHRVNRVRGWTSLVLGVVLALLLPWPILAERLMAMLSLSPLAAWTAAVLLGAWTLSVLALSAVVGELRFRVFRARNPALVPPPMLHSPAAGFALVVAAGSVVMAAVMRGGSEGWYGERTAITVVMFVPLAVGLLWLRAQARWRVETGQMPSARPFYES